MIPGRAPPLGFYALAWRGIPTRRHWCDASADPPAAGPRPLGPAWLPRDVWVPDCEACASKRDADSTPIMVLGTTVWFWHRPRRLWFLVGATRCVGSPVTLCGARLHSSVVDGVQRSLPDHADCLEPATPAPGPRASLPPPIPSGCRRCTGGLVDGPTGPHRKSCGCPCVAEGCVHAAGDDIQAFVDGQQRRLRERHGVVVTPRTRAQLRAVARWYELEALRGYTGVVDEDGLTSADRDRQYAANQRWLVELLDAGFDINRSFDELRREHGKAAPVTRQRKVRR